MDLDLEVDAEMYGKGRGGGTTRTASAISSVDGMSRMFTCSLVREVGDTDDSKEVAE